MSFSPKSSRSSTPFEENEEHEEKDDRPLTPVSIPVKLTVEEKEAKKKLRHKAREIYLGFTNPGTCEEFKAHQPDVPGDNLKALYAMDEEDLDDIIEEMDNTRMIVMGGSQLISTSAPYVLGVVERFAIYNPTLKKFGYDLRGLKNYVMTTPNINFTLHDFDNIVANKLKLGIWGGIFKILLQSVNGTSSHNTKRQVELEYYKIAGQKINRTVGDWKDYCTRNKISWYRDSIDPIERINDFKVLIQKLLDEEHGHAAFDLSEEKRARLVTGDTQSHDSSSGREFEISQVLPPQTEPSSTTQSNNQLPTTRVASAARKAPNMALLAQMLPDETTLSRTLNNIKHNIREEEKMIDM